MREGEDPHRHEHHQGAEPEEATAGEAAQQDGARQAARCAEDEVEHRGEGCLVEAQPEALHEDLGRYGIRPHVYPHVAHDPEEAEEGRRAAQQAEALGEAHRLARGLVLEAGGVQRQHAEDTDSGIDGEEDAPAEAELGDGLRRAPGGDERSEEGGYGLNELPEGQAAGQLVWADEVTQQRVERGLHDGVAYPEEGEGEEHHPVALPEEGDEEREYRQDETHEDGALAPDPIHQHARRDGAEEEPEEDE